MSEVQWTGNSADEEKPSGDNIRQFTLSKWFTRGWALQELLVREVTLFYNRNWPYFEARNKLVSAKLVLPIFVWNISRNGSLDTGQTTSQVKSLVQLSR
jgi:hypothetical protein